MEKVTLHAGRWLLRAGIGIVTATGWAVGAYTWITGRRTP